MLCSLDWVAEYFINTLQRLKLGGRFLHTCMKQPWSHTSLEGLVWAAYVQRDSVFQLGTCWLVNNRQIKGPGLGPVTALAGVCYVMLAKKKTLTCCLCLHRWVHSLGLGCGLGAIARPACSMPSLCQPAYTNAQGMHKVLLVVHGESLLLLLCCCCTTLRTWLAVLSRPSICNCMQGRVRHVLCCFI